MILNSSKSVIRSADLVQNLLAARRPTVPLLSIVVPVYNEEDTIVLFVDRMLRFLDDNELKFEIVFVNDGSKDGTLDALFRVIGRDERIRCINLSRNFGKEAAMSAGIDQAKGDAVIPMDVDLQDPPELVTRFISLWRQGYDVVYGVREDRGADTKTKRATAGWFYRLFNKVSLIHIPENAGDYRLLDRRVVEALKRLPERNRFMKGLFAWVGFRSVGIPYTRQSRCAGDSKWSYW